MDVGISREDALFLLKKYVKKENMIKHSLATEAVMRNLAKRLKEDQEKWGITGLLHDIDVEITNANLNIHGLEAEKILKEINIAPEIIEAIVRHNEVASKKPRETALQHALASAETITGLITATALVYPDKKLASVKTKSIIKRMKEKLFAASVNREIIKECEHLGLTLEEFCEIALKAMQEIHEVLDL